MSQRLGIAIAAISCACLSACAVDTISRQTREYASRQSQELQVTASKFNQGIARDDRASATVQRIDKPWVSGKPMPLSRELALPKPLRTEIKTTLIFKKAPSSLLEIAQRISSATQIPVRVKPEALLPREQFLPRLSGNQQAAASVMTAPSAITLTNAPLVHVLDHIAAAHEVHWHYTGKAIEFYRTKTRVFNVRALTLSATASMRLGKSSDQASQGFDSASQTELSLAAQNTMSDIAKQLEPFLTKAGSVVAQPGSLTSVVVTDTPDALDSIGTYLEGVNRRLTRRVRLVFEQMTVTRQQKHEQGIDWQLSLASELAALELPTGQAGAAPTLLQLSAPTMGGLTTALTLKAVSRYADVVRHTTVPVMTLNRRPVTHAVRSTFTYVDHVKSVAMNSSDKKAESTLPGIAVSQKRETVGAFLTLVPDVQDDGQILLSVAFDNTVAMPLKTLTFGTNNSQLQIQQLDLRGNGTVQQIVTYPGRPTLIAGFEHQVNEVNQARRSPDAPKLFGGDDAVEHQQTMTLIFVTAQVYDGV